MKKFFKWVWTHNKWGMLGPLLFGAVTFVAMLITDAVAGTLGDYKWLGLIFLTLGLVAGIAFPYHSYKKSTK